MCSLFLKERLGGGNMDKFKTRMGDGMLEYMTADEIRGDIDDGVEFAAKRAKIEPLTKEEKDRIFEIVTMRGNICSVEAEQTVVSTTDCGAAPFCREAAIPVKRSVEALIHERAFCSDSYDLGFTEYSFKAIKPIVRYEAQEMRNAQQQNVMPILYGAMPNMGFYTKPDGPCDNWSELLPAGKIDRARESQEEAAEHCLKDILAVAGEMSNAGADGINLDTCGASGDVDFWVGLRATEEIGKKWPDLGVMFGAAGEFVLGMHGKIKYNGKTIAGMYPHQQAEVVQEAGASIYGPAMNTVSNKSFAWNIARVTTWVKKTSESVDIPIHVNCGMGVGGVCMTEMLPVDVVCRADMCLIEIGKTDGL
jgi:dimethylamine--corrinoid protein Co-methyltransferase